MEVESTSRFSPQRQFWGIEICSADAVVAAVIERHVIFALHFIRAAIFPLRDADQFDLIKKARANETEREYLTGSS